MFLMTKDQVEEELAKINAYLSKHLWMDFGFAMMHDGKVVMVGSLDETWGERDISIEFEQPHFIQTMFDWNTDPQSGPIIELASEEEFMESNHHYKPGKDDYIFKINVEDAQNTPIFVVAPKIKCVILAENTHMQ